MYSDPERLLLFEFSRNYSLAAIGHIFSISVPVFAAYVFLFVGKLIYIYINLGYIFGIVLLFLAFFDEIIQSEIYTYRKYLELVENANVGILQVNKEAEVIYHNPKINEILGYSIEKSKSKNILSFIYAEDYENAKKFIQNVLNSNESVVNELQCRLKEARDGKTKWVRLVKPLKSDFPNKKTITFYLWDITKEKELEELQEQFIATTSHELTTPLLIISGYIEILQTRQNISKEEKRVIYQTLSRNVKRLKALIQNVHGFSRISRHLFDIEPQEIIFSQFYQEIKTQVALLHPNRTIFTNVQCYDLDETFFIDPHLMNQIIANLVSNAAKNSPPDSIIEITLILTVKEFIVVVEDYGCGIPQDVLFRVGQPFMHLNTEYSTGGTGLGLFIIKNIIFSHKGALEIHTRESIGTTFCVSIPRKNV
ncbi:MAG: ATP-binding protein [Candidatus Hodarchaeales archaeon]